MSLYRSLSQQRLVLALVAGTTACAPTSGPARATLTAVASTGGPIASVPGGISGNASTSVGAQGKPGTVIPRDPPEPERPKPVAPAAGTSPASSVGGSSGGSSSGSDGATSLLVPTLKGRVTAPLPIISDHGGGIISNNGGSILSNNGAGIVSDAWAGVVSNNGAGVVSNNGAGIVIATRTRYQLASAYAGDGPLQNAFLYLTNPAQAFLRDAGGGLISTSSDATGAFEFGAGASQTGRETIINALLNDNLRLAGFVAPGVAGETFHLSVASTAATEFLRGEAFALGRAMGSYDQPKYRAVVDQTLSAMQSGDIAAVKTVTATNGAPTLVGAFDLRLDQTAHLRNQYAVALSAVDVGNSAVHALSSAWMGLLGVRPAAVTSVAGNGHNPQVSFDFAHAGFATGDQRNGAVAPADGLPMGYPYGVAVSARGDVFVSAYADAYRSGHIRWFRPDGRVTSVWLQDLPLAAPGGIALVSQPVDSPGPGNPPGYLVVADSATGYVSRIPILENPLLDGSGKSLYPVEIVAGEAKPLSTDPLVEPAHPNYHDVTMPPPALDGSSPLNAPGRLLDQGNRLYADGSPIPNPARYAALAYVNDVAVDPLGNVYIADLSAHRIYMVVSAAGAGRNYFGYRDPIDANHDGVVDGYGALVTMQAGQIYAIAGAPRWEPSLTPGGVSGSWFGEYAASDGGPAQRAHLDQPISLAYAGGALYVSDFDNQRIRRIAADGTISTVAGAPPEPQIHHAGTTDFDYPAGSAGDGGAAVAARLSFPRGITVDPQGRVMFIDGDSGRIRQIGLDGVITTLAGRLTPAGVATSADHFQDGEARRWADLAAMQFLALDPVGNVLFTEIRHYRLRKLWRQWDGTS